MADFVEVADRVWVARYEWFDVNVTLVGGARGLLMVDTHASERAARAVVGDVRRLGAGGVVAVVNTHEHFDHTFGNVVLREEYGELPIHAHEQAAERTVSAGERIKELYVGSGDPHTDEVRATRILPADHTLSSARSLDLGDRLVELVHPGRGHTGGDLVVRVPDVDVMLAGDLVEESAMRDAVPGLGPDNLADDARDDLRFKARALDLWVSKGFQLGEQQARVRVGNQVISWGESLFLPGGINSTNAIAHGYQIEPDVFPPQD